MEFLSPETMKNLMQVCLGEMKADVVIRGADLVNVYSGELLKGFSVATKGKWIAYIGPDASHTIGPDTHVIDASGKVVAPGFIDGHSHMIYYASPHEFLRYAMKGGTTSIITETVELSFTSGYRGILNWLDQVRDQPIKIFSTVPPSITFSKEAEKRAPTLEQLLELLRLDEVVGVGEGFWQQVLRTQTRYPTLSAEARRLKKSAEGHAAGCRSERLAAYAAFGVSSCHESVSAEEVIEKLRLGMWVMVRQGSIRKELDAISRIKDMPLDFRRLTLVTDGVDPRDLVEKGYMECVVQRAIDLGFDPVLAIQMATLNAAEHFGLDNILGGIAPGKCADMVIIPDLHTIKAQYVLSNGRLIVEDGEIRADPRVMPSYSRGFKELQVNPSDFAIRTENKGPLRVRVIEQLTELVTREVFLDLVPSSGELEADPERDLLKVSLISGEGHTFTGLIRGHGFRNGAMATSGLWETLGTLVVGANDTDMATAVNRVHELGGGIVLCAGMQVQAEIDLSISGIMSILPIEALARGLRRIQEKAEALGFRFPDAALSLATLTTPAIPFLRLSEEGLVDVRKGQVVEFMVSL
jgi:adenine deaminase